MGPVLSTYTGGWVGERSTEGRTGCGRCRNIRRTTTAATFPPFPVRAPMKFMVRGKRAGRVWSQLRVAVRVLGRSGDRINTATR